MKKIFSLFVALVLISGVSFAQADVATEGTPAADGPNMNFEVTEIDYGVIEYDTDPYRSFQFTNTGNAPLQVTHAKGSCGCTIPEYPKEPIFPGETGEIKVRYDTKRDTGKPFMKRVTVTTNEAEGGKQRVLVIKGTVLKRAKEEDGLPASQPSIFAPDGE